MIHIGYYEGYQPDEPDFINTTISYDLETTTEKLKQYLITHEQETPKEDIQDADIDYLDDILDVNVLAINPIAASSLAQEFYQNKDLYIGWMENDSIDDQQPNFIFESIDTNLENCQFRTAWGLESRGLISSEVAENNDIDELEELGIHIMKFPVETLKAMRKINAIRK